MQPPTVYIYGLIDPRNGTLRYVGKTNNLKRRLNFHIIPASLKVKSHKINWLRELRHAGLKPEIFVIEEVEEALWEEAEIFWIAYFRAIGAELTNACMGGRGSAKPDDFTRKKISEKLRGRPITANAIAATIQRNRDPSYWTDERREAQAAAQKKRFQEQGHPSTGNRRSPESRKRMSDAQRAAARNRVYSDETRRKLSEASKKGRAARNPLATAKKYIVTSPTGEVFHVFGLRPFCLEHKLDAATMTNLANGKKGKAHKGWTCAHATD